MSNPQRARWLIAAIALALAIAGSLWVGHRVSIAGAGSAVVLAICVAAVVLGRGFLRRFPEERRTPFGKGRLKSAKRFLVPGGGAAILAAIAWVSLLASRVPDTPEGAASLFIRQFS